jgi:hypothetical protein
VNKGIDDGYLSVKKAASSLKVAVEELGDLLRSYEIQPAFEM